MGKHNNPSEKEFLIHQYKSNMDIKTIDFCEIHSVSNSAFKHWQKGGLEGLARADSRSPDVLPEGVDRTEESYARNHQAAY